MSVKLTKEIFLERSVLKHGNKYDYSKVDYVDIKTKVCIICPIHGEFWQTPEKHMSGQGCPKCSASKRNESRQITTEEFIRRSKEMYGDRFLYDKCNVITMQKKVVLTCKIHGDFEITPASHLRKDGGCKECLKINQHNKYTKDKDTFIKEAKQIHGDKYDYSKVEYINNKTKVCIICPIHGEFWQTPTKHIDSGEGCRKCGYEQSADKNKLTTEEFIVKAKQIHGDKYDYSKVEYINYDKKVCIVCPIHGEFWQSLDSHLQGCGCAKCSYVISKPENELCEYLNQFIEIQTRNRTILNGKELDIYIPSKNIAIEYNGLRWHSEEFGKDKFYHLNKTIECNKNGVKLLQIFEDEYINHKEIILSKVSHILGIKRDLPKIMGRKCEIEIIPKDIAKKFLNDFHIQGFTPSTVYLGAVCNKKLIAVMAFKEEIKGSNKWELTRFASDYNYICCGVGGKLFNWFIRNYNPMEVKSFADRRWTLDKDDNIYTKLGFELVSILEPDYKYYNSKIDKYKRVHKFNFRKQTLHKKYGLPLTMTESEMAQELGYSKIWDCGLLKFVWKMK